MSRREHIPIHRGNWILQSFLIGILFIIGLSNIGIAQENLLLQLKDLQSAAELALYFANATVLAPTESDARINLQAMLDMFSEPDPDQQPAQLGLIRLATDVAIALEQLEFLPHTELDFSNAISSVRIYLLLTEEAGINAETEDDETLRASARRAYAYLLAALGSDESGLGLAGIRQMIQWLPDSAIWVSPNDSIQDAIDRVLPGGTIHLAPGTYTLSSSLMVGKPLTLTKNTAKTGSVLLVGPDEGASIYVGNDTSEGTIEVSICNLSIRGGTNGIVVGLLRDIRWGDSTKLSLTQVVISNCLKSGVTIVSSNAVLHDCQIRGNGEFGILVPLDGEIEISGCKVAENGTPELAATAYQKTAGIHAPGRAILSIADSTIEANADSGIHVGSAVQLDLKRSRVIDNGGDGLLVWDHASVHIEECEFLNNIQMGIRFSDLSCHQSGDSSVGHSFIGTVSGWSNLIPDRSEINGNEAGSICPVVEYHYLLESRP